MEINSEKTGNAAALTDVGKVREHNEDSYCVNHELGLYIVADGMGGHASGEVASEIAVSTIAQQIKQGSGLVDAIESAHLAIIKGVETGAGKPGMGTTVVAVLLKGDEFTLAWVGDSRAYLWDERLVQISKDHSLVQMLLDSKKITPAEARVHPRKNIIYQNLGAVDAVQVSMKQGVLYENQKIILCSDGLSDELDDKQIEEVVTRGETNKSVVENLLRFALDNGGKDNVTIIAISAAQNAPKKPALDFLRTEKNKDTLIPDA